MKCLNCGKEMVNTIGGNYHCDNCGFAVNDLVYRQRAGTARAISEDNPFIQQGWQCPKCGAILSPHQDYCPFCSGKLSGRVATTSTPCVCGTNNDIKLTSTLRTED